MPRTPSFAAAPLRLCLPPNALPFPSTSLAFPLPIPRRFHFLPHLLFYPLEITCASFRSQSALPNAVPPRVLSIPHPYSHPPIPRHFHFLPYLVKTSPNNAKAGAAARQRPITQKNRASPKARPVHSFRNQIVKRWKRKIPHQRKTYAARRDNPKRPLIEQPAIRPPPEQHVQIAKQQRKQQIAQQQKHQRIHAKRAPEIKIAQREKHPRCAAPGAPKPGRAIQRAFAKNRYHRSPEKDQQHRKDQQQQITGERPKSKPTHQR